MLVQWGAWATPVPAVHVCQSAICLQLNGLLSWHFFTDLGNWLISSKLQGKDVVLTTKYLKRFQKLARTPCLTNGALEPWGHTGVCWRVENRCLGEKHVLWTLSLLLRVFLPMLPVRGDDFKIQHFVRLKIIPELSSLAHEHNPGQIWFDKWEWSGTYCTSTIFYIGSIGTALLWMRY